MKMPAVHAAHVHLRVGLGEPAPTAVAVHDHHNGGRVPTGELLLVMHERLGLGVTLSGRPEEIIDYLEGCIATINATEVPERNGLSPVPS
jgi:hypothetical protein